MYNYEKFQGIASLACVRGVQTYRKQQNCPRLRNQNAKLNCK